MPKIKLTKEEKQELRQQRKSWNQFIKKMELKGALIIEETNLQTDKPN